MSYIDRNALGIGYAKREIFNDPAYADGWNAAIEILENTPDADVEPIRHGRWVDENGETVRVIDGVPEKSCWCSRCGDWLTGSDEYATKGHYCPNCGAHMDQGETKHDNNIRL